ncbi:uncharacterized protein LOC134722461 [Mytilus trossulus]|uniref:uncharacterized protein LOC134722461 n=1 Tax=Mytilus trossulus TaxID=6551 RepID=UPI0030056DF9
MDEKDNVMTIFKALFQNANQINNKESFIRELVEKGLLKDCDALNQNVDTEEDVELLVAKLKPQLLKSECRVSCLSIMESHGVCVHNHSQLKRFITCEKELPILCCWQEPTPCSRRRVQSHEITGSEKRDLKELHKHLRLPGVRIETEERCYRSLAQVEFDNIISYPLTIMNPEQAIDSGQLTRLHTQIKSGVQRQISDGETFRNTIIGNWKYIKDNIHLTSFSDNCLKEGLLDFDDVESNQLLVLPTSRKIDDILATIVSNIDDSADFNRFLKVFEKDEHQQHIADKLKVPVHLSWIEDVIQTKQCYHRLKKNRATLEDEMKPKKCADDFLEGFILSLDEHEQLWKLDTRKKMAEYLFDRILLSVDRGSYSILLKVLEQQNPNRFKKILKKLDVPSGFQEDKKNETIVGPDLKDGTFSEETEEKKNKTTVRLKIKDITCSEQTDNSKEISITITTKLGLENQHCEKILMEKIMNFGPDFLGKLGLYPSEIKKGSVVIYLDQVSGDCIAKLKNSVINRELVKIIEALFNSDEIKNCLSPGHSCIEVSIAVDKTQLSEVKSTITVSQTNKQYTILRASKKLLLEEIDPLTLLDGFTKRNCHIFVSSKLSKIKTKKERTEKFIEILLGEEERCFDIFLEVLEEKKMLFVLKILQLWQHVRLTDISVLRQNILQNISEIADELYIDDMQEELMERNIFSEEVFDDLSVKFPDNSQQQIIELIVDLLKSEMTSHLIDIMLLNGMNVLVSKLVIPEKETSSKDKDENICQADYVVVSGKDLPEGVLFEGVINVDVIVTTHNVQQIFPSREDTLRRFELSSAKIESMIEIVSQRLASLTGLHKEVLKQIDSLHCSGNSSTLDLEACSKGLYLIENSIPKFWNTNKNTMTLSATGNTELVEVFAEVQCLMSNCQTIPEIDECNHDSFLTSVYDYKSKFIEENPDSQIKEKQETSINDELVKSNPMSAECTKIHRPIKRQISQTEFDTLPEITIRTIDGSLKHIKEKKVPKNSKGNISMKASHEIGTKDNSLGTTDKEKTQICSDKLSASTGASIPVNFKDIIRVRMTEKGWKELCESETKRGDRLSLVELPQVCAPDTILLLDLSGSMKGTAFIDMKDAVNDFLDKESANNSEQHTDTLKF